MSEPDEMDVLLYTMLVSYKELCAKGFSDALLFWAPKPKEVKVAALYPLLPEVLELARFAEAEAKAARGGRSGTPSAREGYE